MRSKGQIVCQCQLKKTKREKDTMNGKKLKENYVWKRYKENKGKLIFLWEEMPSLK